MEQTTFQITCQLVGAATTIKATLDVEGFRKYLSKIHKRLMRDSIPYQVAERFGIVKHMSDNVKFYFEKVEGDDYVENNKERRYCSGDREVSG